MLSKVFGLEIPSQTWSALTGLRERPMRLKNVWKPWGCVWGTHRWRDSRDWTIQYKLLQYFIWRRRTEVRSVKEVWNTNQRFRTPKQLVWLNNSRPGPWNRSGGPHQIRSSRSSGLETSISWLFGLRWVIINHMSLTHRNHIIVISIGSVWYHIQVITDDPEPIVSQFWSIYQTWSFLTPLVFSNGRSAFGSKGACGLWLSPDSMNFSKGVLPHVPGFSQSWRVKVPWSMGVLK